MIYGFKKGCYDKAQLDALTWKQRFALAEQDENSGKAFINSETSNEMPEINESFFWLYDTIKEQEMIGYKPVDEPKKVFVLVYTSFDSEGLYTETKVFDSLEKAITEKEVYIKSELSDNNNHFGGLFEDVCGGDLQEFQETYVEQLSDTKYHMIDTYSDDYYLFLDIYEQVVC